jgi:transmembrane sensor
LEISKFTIEDFVLDKDFRIWVLSPSKSSNVLWDKILEKNSHQVKNVKIAKELVMNISSKKHGLNDEEYLDLWNAIDLSTKAIEPAGEEKTIIPIYAESILKKYEIRDRRYSWFNQDLRVACILIVVGVFSFLLNFFFNVEDRPEESIPELVYEEYFTPPGVKSTLTLQDGSKVILNSGSSIRYVKNFESNKREIYLEGEGYFEVAKDSVRPFSVITKEVKTTALGTVFNITAYSHEDLKVSLVEGKVAIDAVFESDSKIYLVPGEMVEVNSESGKLKKSAFDSEMVLAWTQKKIVFKRVKVSEAIRVLENWYGVKFIFLNKPKSDLMIFGVFQDEMLENILQSLSYTARFEFEIEKDTVKIKFI